MSCSKVQYKPGGGKAGIKAEEAKSPMLPPPRALSTLASSGKSPSGKSRQPPGKGEARKLEEVALTPPPAFRYVPAADLLISLITKTADGKL